MVFENDRVRVLHFTELGHSKLPMHSHSAYVTVGFTTDHSKYTFPDGKTSDDRTKAGGATYSKGLTHAYENLSGTASESVMVELKKPGASGAKTMSKAHDATWADARKHLPENIGDKPIDVIVIELK